MVATGEDMVATVDMEATATEAMEATGAIVATGDMEATATITVRGPLMLSLLQPLKRMPNPDTEAMAAMEAMVDTEGMEAMVATGEDMAAMVDMEAMATITARGPLMLSLLLSLKLMPNPDTEAMEAMVDTEGMEAMAMEDMVATEDMEAMATITARGPLMLSLLPLLKLMPNPDTEAMVAME